MSPSPSQPWLRYGVTQAEYERAQARGEWQRELDGITAQEIDQELRDLPGAALERLAAHAPDLRDGRSWQALSEDERRGQRAVNELTRRRMRAQQAEATAAREAERQATRDAEGAAAVAVFQAQARAAFPGTDAEFAAQWPAIKAAWQQQQALAAHDDLLARKRAEIGPLF